jgi:hypothetical protein
MTASGIERTIKNDSDKPLVTARVYFWQATALFLSKGAAGDVFVLGSSGAVTNFPPPGGGGGRRRRPGLQDSPGRFQVTGSGQKGRVLTEFFILL